MKKYFSSMLISTLLTYQAAFAQGYNSADSQQQKSREFLMSCTYGVLTGALVGAASLAFSNNPGDKLHRIARGASLGLYSGIFLGYYVTNYVEEGPEMQPGYNYGSELAPQKTRFLLFPILGQKGIEGFEFQLNLVNF